MRAYAYLGPWRDAPWDVSRWPNFSARELACPCCGEICVWPHALDAVQRLRVAMSAPLSRHKQLAFDVRLAGHDPMRLQKHARETGFTGFGFGNTFLHLDTRPYFAHWFYGKRSIEKWTSLGLSIR